MFHNFVCFFSYPDPDPGGRNETDPSPQRYNVDALNIQLPLSDTHLTKSFKYALPSVLVSVQTIYFTTRPDKHCRVILVPVKSDATVQTLL